MRPALKSGLLPVWRDRDTLQIGIDPRRAVALSGMREAAVLIGLLDGSRDRGQVVSEAARHGVAPAASERVLTLLAAGGALDDFPARALRETPGPLRRRLAAELATTSLVHRDGDGGTSALTRRRAALVAITGDQRIAVEITRILRSSGVAARRTPPDRACGQTRCLAIVVGPLERQERARCDQYVRDRVPHLVVTAGEGIGVVGPLVIPGDTSCLRCLDYTRASQDPAWPLILAQATARRPEPPACDTVLTAAVAAQAAAQALIAIDRAPAHSAAANGTLELVLPDYRWRRRNWIRHPACTCGLASRPAHPS